MAQYYLAPLGEVLRGMLPLMAEVRRTVYYRITDLGRDVLAEHGWGVGNSQVSNETWARMRRKGAPSAGSKLSAEEQDLERRVLARLASGEPVKVSTLRTATAATLPVLAGLMRKKWIARETAAAERDARRTERFAVLIPEARLPALTVKQQAILAELAACGGELPLSELRRKDLPSSTLQTLVRRGLVRIDERPAAFRLGGMQSQPAPLRLNEPQIDALASWQRLWGDSSPFYSTESQVRARRRFIWRQCSGRWTAACRRSCWFRRSASRRKVSGLLDAAFGRKSRCSTPR